MAPYIRDQCILMQIYRRTSVPVVRCIPYLFRGTEGMERRRCGPSISQCPHRYPHRLRFAHDDNQNSLDTEYSRGSSTRDSSPPHDCGRCLSPDRPLLVRLDQLSTHISLAANHFRHTHRLRHDDHHPARHQLPHRLLHHLRRLCYCRHNAHSKSLRCSVPLVFNVHVSKCRRAVGSVDSWVHCCRTDAGARCVLHLWCENPKMEYIRPVLKTTT